MVAAVGKTSDVAFACDSCRIDTFLARYFRWWRFRDTFVDDVSRHTGFGGQIFAENVLCIGGYHDASNVSFLYDVAMASSSTR